MARNPEVVAVEGGYEYLGHYLERCPGNQWNVYRGSDRSYPEGLVAEGCTSLAQALALVDQGAGA